MNLKFIRKLQHRVTTRGTDIYTVTVPPEIAQALKLEDGGLCSITIRTWPRCKAVVTLEPYKDHPLMVDRFDPSRVHSGDGTLGFIHVPVSNPTTRGPSRSLWHRSLIPYLKASKAALKFVKADMARLGYRRRRRTKRKRRYT